MSYPSEYVDSRTPIFTERRLVLSRNGHSSLLYFLHFIIVCEGNEAVVCKKTFVTKSNENIDESMRSWEEVVRYSGEYAVDDELVRTLERDAKRSIALGIEQLTNIILGRTNLSYP